MIKIENLTKRFGKKTVLNRLNVVFEAGKVYGIVGENGAGKTTLFRCIAGLESFEGKIIADKLPIKNHLGLLLTEPFFFSKITGKEYIRLLCQARGIKTGAIDDRNIFDLPLDQYASTYSTGMKKKLAITAVLMQKNEFFILDEPFNGVDIHSNMIITEIIRKLGETWKTTIISSHIFSTLKDTCNEIYVLENGAFVRRLQQEEFGAFELEMKEMLIGNKIGALDL
ncbi:MAG TPA: ATP-binding cassette domain-containing protein [Edaphocola sp.]|nr:ATP-binding cassette domain-containing protein [Edaphocola sp.]